MIRTTCSSRCTGSLADKNKRLLTAQLNLGCGESGSRNTCRTCGKQSTFDRTPAIYKDPASAIGEVSTQCESQSVTISKLSCFESLLLRNIFVTPALATCSGAVEAVASDPDATRSMKSQSLTSLDASTASAAATSQAAVSLPNAREPIVSPAHCRPSWCPFFWTHPQILWLVHTGFTVGDFLFENNFLLHSSFSYWK